MAQAVSERDLFVSHHPQLLLRGETRNALESRFGPLPATTDWEWRELLIDTIYRKYNRVDLVKWDPDHLQTFHDYRTGHYLSLDELEKRLDEYSPMATQRLQEQLDLALKRWGPEERFVALRNRIVEKNNRILSTEAITA